MRLQPRPAPKSILACDRELSICQAEIRLEDRLIGRLSEARMKFADALCDSAIAACMSFQDILGLIFQVLQVWLRRETFYRHDELPFVCPGPHVEGRKSVRKSNCKQRWTS